jgi:hypothetical protein
MLLEIYMEYTLHDFIVDNDGNLRIHRLPKHLRNGDKFDLHKLMTEYRRIKKLIGEKKMNELMKIIQQKVHKLLVKKRIEKKRSGLLPAVAIFVPVVVTYLGF